MACYPQSFAFISPIYLLKSPWTAFGKVIGPTCSLSQSSRPTRHVSASLASWPQFKVSCWCDGWHLTHVSAPWLATVHCVFSLNSFLLVLKRKWREAFSAFLRVFFFFMQRQSPILTKLLLLHHKHISLAAARLKVAYFFGAYLLFFCFEGQLVPVVSWFGHS